MARSGPASTRPQRRWLPNLAGIAVAALLVAVVTALLYARVALTGAAEARPALTVATVRYHWGESYTRPVSYLGLVVAGRRANLGFEIAGRVAALPVREGSPVVKGQQIATLDDSALQARRRATAADLEQARAELELARLKERRQRNLSETGAVSKEAYDETRLRARALASQVEAVTARLASIDIELEKSRLLAPYDGVIANRHVYAGDVVSPGTPVVRLLAITAQEAHVGVSAERAGALKIGNSYPLALRGSPIEARLVSVRPDVDPLTRTTTAVFALPAGVDALDGEPVTLEYEEPVMSKGGWLPITALLEGQRGMWNLLRLEATDSGYIALRETVEVLDIQGDRAYVRGTLPGEAQVIASGVHRISPGSPVSPQESR